MLVRFSEGRAVWQGGRDHSSHRLVYSGMSEKRAVAVLLGIVVNCTAVAIALVILQDTLLIALAVGATLAALVAFGSQLVVISEQTERVELEPRVFDHVKERDAQVG
jgi:UDP-GlcNAc:undecaprenyl-phosphate/decaprenyl-phosphate GlcNAc-1-phosphate transferase